MHLFKTYSQFSFDSSNGGATAVEFSHKKTDEKPCENLTSRSAFFTKPRWYPGAYSQISGAIERASSRAVILNKGFAPNPVISASDPIKDELDRLQKIEKDIAERYGIPSVSYIDSVHLFQVVKDRANKTEDKESLSDLRDLDIILERRMELKTGGASSHTSYRFHPSQVWSLICDLSARWGIQYLFRKITKLLEQTFRF